MSTTPRTAVVPPSTAPADTGKGLRAGQIGMVAAIVIGVSTIAPAYVLTSSLGPTAAAVGEHLPAIFLVGFIPMFLVALGYRELNSTLPDAGTTFTWTWKAFGPRAGWMGGWGLLAANIIVLSNLAGVAVDFLYLFLAQLTGRPEIADLAADPLVNIGTCLALVALAVWVSCRGLNATRGLQAALVGFQVVVLAWFVTAAWGSAGTQPGSAGFSWDWFNPLNIGSFSAFAVGLSLSIFAFWGWDVCLTMNEETTDGGRASGVAAGVTAVVVLVIYLAGSVAATVFAGAGAEGLGLANPENSGNLFAALANPVMGPFAILLSLSVLSSCAASLQSTMLSPARSLLAMGHHGALPARFSTLHPRYRTPVFATVFAGAVSAGFYALMRLLSTNVLNDTILALGMMICFYYGMTALACAWFFRRTAFASVRNLLLRLVAPLVGGAALVAVFIQTAVDSLDPEYGSGSHVGGVGLVFVVGVGILAVGALFLLGAGRRRPGFYRAPVEELPAGVGGPPATR